MEKTVLELSVPIYQTATFSHPGLGESTGYDYTRMQNPTREHLEKTVAALEKDATVWLFIRNGSDHYRNGAV